MPTHDSSPTQPRESSSDDFEAFLTEYLTRIERDGSVAIEDFRARHPEFASRLGRQLEWLAEHLGRHRGAAPERIGPYRVMNQLGRGGMGEVYLCEQTAPFRRLVAVKVVRMGPSDSSRIRRFANEVQLLASLNHNGIAKAYDAGDDHGLPWFSMEYVPGKSLTTYCTEERLGIVERLRLFLEVCSAVEYAHRQGVLHRDLKPSNILVYGPRSQPVVKVIDFGLAKLIQPDAALTHPTQTGQIVGTPDYMSPEQVDADSRALVDTRTDVYALGVVLYELLTGVLPLSLATLGVNDLRLLVRTIKEREPSSPSVRVEESESDSATSPTACAGVSAHALSRLLAGDLDSIVMKALAKDVDRRYGSVAHLSDDIHRYLRHEPVTSRRWSRPYLARKFLQRHRGAAAAVATLLLVLVVSGTIIGMQTLARWDQLERNELYGMARYLDELRLREETPPPARPEHVDTLDQRLQALESMLAQEARIRGFLARNHAGARQAGAWNETDDFEAAQRDGLAATLEMLRLMNRPGAEVAELRARLDWARRVEALTVADHRDEWNVACRAIAADDPYHFQLVPQIGLVPLGKDPVSRLQEFGLLLPDTELPRRVEGRLVLTGRTCPVFVLLPGGDVTLGAQREDANAPRHDPDLSPTEDALANATLPPFFASKFEFTNGQWASVQAGLHRGEPAEEYDDPLRPLVNADHVWMQHVMLAWGMRLPTWQEWEYLARGGSDFPFAPGPRESDLRGHANLLDLTARRGKPTLGEGGPVPWEDRFVRTSPVGSFGANGYGLHDVHGNALEPAIRGERDGIVEIELRGGSWNQGAGRARILFRPLWSQGPLPSIGFRPVISVRP